MTPHKPCPIHSRVRDQKWWTTLSETRKETATTTWSRVRIVLKYLQISHQLYLHFNSKIKIACKLSEMCGAQHSLSNWPISQHLLWGHSDGHYSAYKFMGPIITPSAAQLCAGVASESEAKDCCCCAGVASEGEDKDGWCCKRKWRQRWLLCRCCKWKWIQIWLLCWCCKWKWIQRWLLLCWCCKWKWKQGLLLCWCCKWKWRQRWLLLQVKVKMAVVVLVQPVKVKRKTAFVVLVLPVKVKTKMAIVTATHHRGQRQSSPSFPQSLASAGPSCDLCLPDSPA